MDRSDQDQHRRVESISTRRRDDPDRHRGRPRFRVGAVLRHGKGDAPKRSRDRGDRRHHIFRRLSPLRDVGHPHRPPRSELRDRTRHRGLHRKRNYDHQRRVRLHPGRHQRRLRTHHLSDPSQQTNRRRDPATPLHAGHRLGCGHDGGRLRQPRLFRCPRTRPARHLSRSRRHRRSHPHAHALHPSRGPLCQAQPVAREREAHPNSPASTSRLPSSPPYSFSPPP